MSPRAAHLREFLRRQCATSGPWHCSTMPADWCVELGHPDFAAEWRGITDAAECETVPEAAGGLVALWDRGIGSSLPVVETYEPGDIAVVTVFEADKGAIFTGEHWALRGERCVHWIGAGHVTVVKAWRP